MKRKLDILGYICMALGMIAAFIWLLPYYLFYSILAGFFGLILSSIYIFIDTRNEINTKRFTPGVLGLILSSVPVLIMLALIIMANVNS